MHFKVFEIHLNYVPIYSHEMMNIYCISSSFYKYIPAYVLVFPHVFQNVILSNKKGQNLQN